MFRQVLDSNIPISSLQSFLNVVCTVIYRNVFQNKGVGQEEREQKMLNIPSLPTNHPSSLDSPELCLFAQHLGSIYYSNTIVVMEL